MIKILQYGEGNFLRTFVDLYFDTLNKENAELRKLLSKNKFKELQYKIQRWCRG